MMTLAWPLLLLLLPLPLLVRRRPQVTLAPQVPMHETLRRLAAQGSRKSSSRRTETFFWLSWTLLLLATARPQWEGEPIPLPTTGRDLMLAVDISPSMEEPDMILNGRQATRLMAVKSVVGEFIQRRKGDRLGLILFGSNPYLQVPLTHDLQTVETQLDEANLGMAGRGTAIGDAIVLALKKLRDRPAEGRVLILLTDGTNTAGEITPEKAAELAADFSIRVHTIGIGAESNPNSGFLGMLRSQPGRELDEKQLQFIADTTHGKFFRARSTPELEMVYETLNTLEETAGDDRYFRPVDELYRWPLLVSLLVMLAAWLPRLRSPRHREDLA